jgi:TP901 family phage tail tape measure protein
MTAGNPANRRVFLIEFVAQDDPIVEALNNITAQLTTLVDHIAKASASVSHLGTHLEKNAREGARVQRASSRVWTDSLVAVGAAYLWLRKVIGGMITSAYELGEVVARTTRVFEQSGASARNLAGAYLDMGRNAAEFMRASVALERANIRGEQSIKNMTVVAFQFGKVMGVSTERAAELLAELRMRLQLTEEQLKKTASAAATLARELNASNEAIMSALKAAPGVVQTFNIEQHALMGFATAFERAGMVGAQSGQFLNTTLTKLADVTQRYKLNLMGVNSEQLTAALQTKDYGKAMDVFTQAVGKDANAWAKRMRILKLASEEEIAMFMNLARNRNQAVNAMREAERAYHDTTNLSRIFGMVTGHLVEQLKLLWEEIRAVGTKIGIFLAPILSTGVMLLRSLVAVLHIIPTPIVGLVGALAVLGISVLGGIVIFGKLLRVFDDLRETFHKTTARMGSFIGEFIKGQTYANSFSMMLRDVGRALARGKWASARNHISLYVAEKVKAIAVTGQSTIATLMENKALMANVTIKKTLIATNKMFIAVQEVANAFLYKGWTAGVLAAKGALMQAFGMKAAASATSWYAIAAAGATAATTALTTALYSIPVIGWIAAAVVGLALALYGLYKMLTSTSRSIKVFGIILAAAFFPLTLTLGVLYALYKILSFLWNLVKAFVSGWLDAMAEILAPLNELYDMFARVYDMFAEMLGLDGEGFFRGVSSMVKSLTLWFHKLIPFVHWIVKGIQILAAILIGAFTAVKIALEPVIVALKQLWGEISAAFHPLTKLFGDSGESGMAFKWVMLAIANTVTDVLVPILQTLIVPLRFIIAFISATVNALGVLFAVLTGDFEAMWGAYARLKSSLMGLIAPFVELGETIIGIAKRVWNALFGSSLFHIKEGIEAVMPYLEALLAPFKLILGAADTVKVALGGMWDSVKEGAGAAFDKVKEFAGAPFKAVGDAAGWLYDKLFGSGFLHINEGVLSAMSSLGNLTGSFRGFGETVGEIRSMVQGLLEAMNATGIAPTVGVPALPTPAPAAARARAAAVTTVAARTALAGREGGAAAAAAELPELQITVPVIMDGEQIATAVARVTREQLIRHGNTPGGAMRGVPI